MKKGFLLTLTVLTMTFVYGQDCSCADTFDWLKETVEKNDAGFHYVIEQKGKDAYQKHSNEYIEKVQGIMNKEECAHLLSEWLRFFRKEHWFFGVNNKQENNIDEAEIKKKFANWETYPYQEKEFDAYVSKIKQPSLEGLWRSSSYKIGVRKVKDEYIGFIIEGDDVYWSRSQVKFKIKEKNGKLTATYYLRDHSVKEINQVTLQGNNYLQLDNFVVLEREKPQFPSSKVDIDFKILLAEMPIFEKLNDKTVLLRIPTFDYTAKKAIDSVIAINRHIITTTENLILDLRYNGGGSDESFNELLPLIYTNPIRTVGVDFLSTPLNNKRMEEFIANSEFPEELKKRFEKGLKKLQKHLGEFVNLEDSDVTITTFDTVYAYPKNVGILINEGCASTTEQFLLAAKQSKKVKLFGTTTVGALDISNMHFINSPCKHYTLGYCLSKSKRIPEFTIDDKGIQPDFYLDKQIPKHEWIEFVSKILNHQ